MDCIVTHEIRSTLRVSSTSILALGLLALAGVLTMFSAIALPTGASAQYYSSPYGYAGPRYRPNGYYLKKKRRIRRVQRKRKRSSKRKPRAYAKTLREPVSDVMILVSLKKQRLYVHDKQGLVAETPISSGRRGMDTPKGIFTILQKNKRHYSNLYAGAPMPNMQRITWSGVAMHGGPLPGYPASHGCIRLPYSFAKTLFGMTSMHGRVIVADNPVKPTEIRHSNLFQPLPGGPVASQEASVAKPETITVAEARPETRIDSDLGTVIGAAKPKATQIARLDDPDRVIRANKYRSIRKNKKAANERELKDARNAHALFQVDAERTADQLKDARAALAKGQAAVKARKRDAQKAKSEAAAAHKKLRDFDRKYRNVSRRQTADRLQTLAELERALDSRALRLSDRYDEALADVVSAERRIAGLESNVAYAAATFKTAKSKLAPVKKRLAQAKAAIARFKEEEKQRAKPISIFISGKTSRLYARQGWYPVLDVPVKIRDPQVALGTHLFTAIDAAENNANAVEWNVITVEDGRDGSDGAKTRYRTRYGKKRNLRRLRSTANPAKLALDRVTIPQDARDKIEDLMKKGSSMIVSDYPKSIETGQHTDFIILTK